MKKRILSLLLTFSIICQFIPLTSNVILAEETANCTHENATELLYCLDCGAILAKAGDSNLDGDIGVDDALLIFRSMASIYKPTGLELFTADTNQNQEIGVDDALLVFRSMASLEAPNVGVPICDIKDSIYSAENLNSDGDEDDLTFFLEIMLGSDPTQNDTDGDGLPDGYEVNILGTDPTKTDTDDNGISDNVEDFDEDGLTNIQEHEYGTYPSLPDTDFDGLSDGDEKYQYETEPLSYDTDEDGINDGLEMELGTSPLKSDSNGNGIPDSEELYTMKKTPADFEVDERAIPELETELKGGQIESLQISKVVDDLFFPENMPGFLGSAYDFTLDGEFEKATLTFKYDTEMSKNFENFHPSIYWFDEENGELIKVENQTLNLENGTVTAEINHFSFYILIEETSYEKVWEDIKNRESKVEKNVDMVFAIDVSGSMSTNDPTGIRISAASKFIDLILPRPTGSPNRTAVVTFNNAATILQPKQLTNIKDYVKMSLNLIGNGGTTSLAAALESSLSLFDSKDTNKNILLVTDGIETYDKEYVRIYENLQKAREQEIAIYTVALGATLDANAVVLLKEVANETGGLFLYAPTSADLYEIYDIVSEDITDAMKDSNGNDIPDFYESRIPAFNGARLNLDPNNPDADGDGIPDHQEIEMKQDSNGNWYYSYKTDPLSNDSDGDGITDADEIKNGTDPLKWDVCDRDLAIFSQLAYCDDAVLKSGDILDKLSDENTEKANKDFEDTASVKEMRGWEVSERFFEKPIIIDEDNKKFFGGFSCTTFKKDDNIVIAFRGTVGEIQAIFVPGTNWNSNIGWFFETDGGSLSRVVMKARLQGTYFKDKNVYLTGHSRGGFLCQMAAVEAVEQGKSDLIKEVTYFNGIGIVWNNKISDESKYLFALMLTIKDKVKRYVIKGDLVGDKSLTGKHVIHPPTQYFEATEKAKEVDPIFYAHLLLNFTYYMFPERYKNLKFKTKGC